MHVMQVFNYKVMIDTVEGFGEVDKSHGDSMGLSFVSNSMDEVKETDEIVGY